MKGVHKQKKAYLIMDNKMMIMLSLQKKGEVSDNISTVQKTEAKET